MIRIELLLLCSHLCISSLLGHLVARAQLTSVNHFHSRQMSQLSKKPASFPKSVYRRKMCRWDDALTCGKMDGLKWSVTVDIVAFIET